MRTSSPFRGALFTHNACVHLFITVKVPANIGCIRLIPHVELCKNQMANTYSKSDLMNVIKYIQNPKEHHKKISFFEEYQKFLQLFEVDFDERYIFKQPNSRRAL